MKVPERDKTIKTPARRHWRCFRVFVITFKHIPHLFVVLLLLNLSMYLFAENYPVKRTF